MLVFYRVTVTRRFPIPSNQDVNFLLFSYFLAVPTLTFSAIPIQPCTLAHRTRNVCMPLSISPILSFASRLSFLACRLFLVCPYVFLVSLILPLVSLAFPGMRSGTLSISRCPLFLFQPSPLNSTSFAPGCLCCLQPRVAVAFSRTYAKQRPLFSL